MAENFEYIAEIIAEIIQDWPVRCAECDGEKSVKEDLAEHFADSLVTSGTFKRELFIERATR